MALIVIPNKLCTPPYEEFTNNFSLIELVKKILYHSSIIKTNTHEINHEFFNFFFLHSKGYFPAETQRKKRN